MNSSTKNFLLGAASATVVWYTYTGRIQSTSNLEIGILLGLAIAAVVAAIVRTLKQNRMRWTDTEMFNEEMRDFRQGTLDRLETLETKCRIKKQTPDDFR